MPEYAVTGARVLGARITQSTHRSGGRNITSYRPIIDYEYEVNGVWYKSNRVIQMEAGFGSYGDVEKFIAARPIGSMVSVYYDPANPTDAFLEKGMGGLGRRGIGIAVGIAIFAGAAVLIGLCVFLVFFAATFGLALLPFLMQ